MSAGEAVKAIVPLASSVLLSCAATPPILVAECFPRTRPPSSGCEYEPACLTFLQRIHNRVMRRWKPPGSQGKVTMGIVLDGKGALTELCVVRGGPPELTASAARAIADAAPFRSQPAVLLLVEGQRILLTFRHGVEGGEGDQEEP